MNQDPHHIDRLAARRAFSAASADYERVAVLQAEVRNRLLERLEWVKLEPSAILDLGCGTGAASQALQDRYPQAQVIALDAAYGMVQQAGHHHSFMQKLLRKQFARVLSTALQERLAGPGVQQSDAAMV
jgi:malonyl-CoA O-methyltransferase